MGSYCWECLIFSHENYLHFLIPPSFRFMSHPSADSSALQCPGDPYLPPELQSAQKLVMEVGKEAGWLTLQLLEIKQWKWDTVINSRKTNTWYKLQSACSAQEGIIWWELMPARFLDRFLQNTWTFKIIIEGFILLFLIYFLMVWIINKILVIEHNIKSKYKILF